MSSFNLGPALLFCPADRPERYSKAFERADAVIIDLEDAVLTGAKPRARAALIASELDPDRVIVRVNSVDSKEFRADIAAIAQTKYHTIMVAKAEDPMKIDNIPGRFSIIALCETARGVQAAHKIARLQSVVGLMWGAEDLIASMGGQSSRKPNGEYRHVAKHARSRVLLAAAAAGKSMIDAVYLDIEDLEGLREEAADAVHSGFMATACIHPSQVEVVRAAYRPTPEQVAWATDLLAAAEGEHGVFQFNGQMIDEPVLRHARSVKHRAAGEQP